MVFIGLSLFSTAVRNKHRLCEIPSELVGTYCAWAVCGVVCLRESGMTSIGFNLTLDVDDWVTLWLAAAWRAATPADVWAGTETNINHHCWLPETNEGFIFVTLRVNSAGKLVIFVLFFPENKTWHFMPIVSFCKKCQILFSEKNITNLSSAEKITDLDLCCLSFTCSMWLCINNRIKLSDC